MHPSQQPRPLQPVRLGLDPSSRTKPPVIEYDWQTAQWRVWTAYNPSLSVGTFFALRDRGVIERRTIARDGMVSVTFL